MSQTVYVPKGARTIYVPKIGFLAGDDPDPEADAGSPAAAAPGGAVRGRRKRNPDPESRYRDLLAEQIGGKAEAALPFGRADVLTDDTVFEVEPIVRWRTGVRQVLAYAAQVEQRGALAVYGDPKRLPEVFTALAKLPEPGLDLWYCAGETFVRIQSAEDAASHHAPEAPAASQPDSPSPVRRRGIPFMPLVRSLAPPLVEDRTYRGEEIEALLKLDAGTVEWMCKMGMHHQRDGDTIFVVGFDLRRWWLLMKSASPSTSDAVQAAALAEAIRMGVPPHRPHPDVPEPREPADPWAGVALEEDGQAQMF